MMDTAPLYHDVADGPPNGRAFWLRTADGLRIRMGHWPHDPGMAARGTVLLFPGRTEYIEKYGRAAADFAQRGFDTVVIDWRGQGLADRMLGNPLTGHVAHFADYQKDLAAVTEATAALELPQPFYLLGHSMGGCIGLRALIEGLDVAACGFTGPMWGIQLAAATRPAAWALSWSSGWLGFGHQPAPGSRAQTYVLAEPFDDNALTRDADMYAYMQRQMRDYPAMALAGPSLRWLNAALIEMAQLARRPAPDVPCLTYLGSHERIVSPERIETRMASWPQGRLEMVPGGEHEVLMDLPATRAMIFDGLAAHYAAHPDTASGRAGTGQRTAGRATG